VCGVRLWQQEEITPPKQVAVPAPDPALPPSFDGDNPSHRYRFLEPQSQWMVRPIVEAHGYGPPPHHSMYPPLPPLIIIHHALDPSFLESLKLNNLNDILRGALHRGGTTRAASRWGGAA